MSSFSMSKRIEAPTETVFDLFTDFANAPRTVSGIERVEMLTDGPVGVGTRFRETRIMFKKEATEVLEVTEFAPGRSYTIGCTSCGCAFATEFRFTPVGSATQVDLEMRTRPVTLFAKLMSPLGRLMAGSMKKCVDRDMEDLKRAAEAQPAART